MAGPVERLDWRAYVLAVAVTGGTQLVRLALAPWVGERPMLVVWLLPIVISAYVGGFGPGLLSTAIGALGAKIFLLPIAHSLVFAGTAELIHWMLLIVTGVLISLLGASLHRWNGSNRAPGDAGVGAHGLAIDAGGRSSPLPRGLTRIALRTSLLYGVLAALWIVASDRLLIASALDPATIGAIETYKGLGFVAVTAGLLYLTLRRQLAHWGREATARRQAEEALRFSELVASKSRDAMLLIRREDGRILEANAAALSSYGYSRDELLGQTIYDLRAPEARVLTPAQMSEADERGILFETTHRRKDGSAFPVEVSSQGATVGGQRVLVSVIRDISERRQKAAAAELTEERYRSLFKNMLNGFAHCQMLYAGDEPQDFIYLAVNDAFENLTGLKGVVGRRVSEVIPGIREDDPELFAIYGRVARTGAPERFETYVKALKTWFEIAVYCPARDQFVAVFDVITARKEAEATLQKRQTQLTEALRISRLAYWEYDVPTDQFLLNDEYYSLLRTSAQQHGGYSISSAEFTRRFVHPDDAAMVGAEIEKSLATKDPNYRGEFDLRFIYGDGKVGYFAVSFRIEKDVAGRTIRGHGANLDITERKRVEAQFRQTQKIEEIGQLAAGITHDFNNVLTVVQMNVSLLEKTGGLSREVAASVREISDAAKRAASLTRQLLTFSRRQVMELTNLDLNGVVANMTHMLKRILGEDIRVELNYAPVPLPIHADAGMIEQILLNLGVNARDAMPKGGRLTIETRAVDLDAAAARELPQARPGQFARLSVTDTGTGISREILPRIFEPFFTTKDVGRGTGLGMATVHGIVQLHHGWIAVESELGRGTSFRIFLPRQLALVAESRPPIPAATTERGGNETILVVEDEAPVRLLLQTVLARFGYRVLEATTGAVALEVWNKHRHEIRLLLTDFLMPDGLTGLDLAQKLIQESPQLRVILTSGYGPDVAKRDLTLDPNIVFLSKPFEVSRLVSTVRACLEATPGQ
ncbi:MAG TPA: PAS domain S-box protein [Opitutaceae bacterium]|nr:PAS domain S-box protein [Opitutaceae bacterium]